MRNLYLLLIISTLFFQKVCAQSNYYVFKTTTGTYNELTGDTPISLKFASGDSYELKQLLGDTYKFFGKAVTVDTITKGIVISTNGFVEVVDGNDIMVFDGLIHQLDSIDNTSKVSYKIDGPAGKKIIKAQWKNVKIPSGQATNYVNLQIWLYQENDIVEYRYGPSSSNNASGYTQATGPSIGVFYSTQTVSTMYQKIWISGTPPSITLDSAKNANFPNIFGVPSNGTVYRFVPKTIAASISKQESTIGFSVYPNPANNDIRITLNNTTNLFYKIQLYDVRGSLIKEFGYQSAGEFVIPTKDIDDGNYILKLEADGKVLQEKVLIQH